MTVMDQIKVLEATRPAIDASTAQRADWFELLAVIEDRIADESPWLAEGALRLATAARRYAAVLRGEVRKPCR